MMVGTLRPCFFSVVVNVNAIDQRHSQVEHEHIHTPCHDARYCIAAIANQFAPVTVAIDKLGQCRAKIRIIFSNQNNPG